VGLVKGGLAGGFVAVECIGVGFLLEDGGQHRPGKVFPLAACRSGQASDCSGVPIGGGMLAPTEQDPGHHQPVPGFQRPFHRPPGPVAGTVHVPGVLMQPRG